MQCGSKRPKESYLEIGLFAGVAVNEGRKETEAGCIAEADWGPGRFNRHSE